MKSEKEIKDRIRKVQVHGEISWIKFQAGFLDALLWVLELGPEEPKPYKNPTDMLFPKP